MWLYSVSVDLVFIHWQSVTSCLVFYEQCDILNSNIFFVSITEELMLVNYYLLKVFLQICYKIVVKYLLHPSLPNAYSSDKCYVWLIIYFSNKSIEEIKKTSHLFHDVALLLALYSYIIAELYLWLLHNPCCWGDLQTKINISHAVRTNDNHF